MSEATLLDQEIVKVVLPAFSDADGEDEVFTTLLSLKENGAEELDRPLIESEVVKLVREHRSNAGQLVKALVDARRKEAKAVALQQQQREQHQREQQQREQQQREQQQREQQQREQQQREQRERLQWEQLQQQREQQQQVGGGGIFGWIWGRQPQQGPQPRLRSSPPPPLPSNASPPPSLAERGLNAAQSQSGLDATEAPRAAAAAASPSNAFASPTPFLEEEPHPSATEASQLAFVWEEPKISHVDQAEFERVFNHFLSQTKERGSEAGEE